MRSSTTYVVSWISSVEVQLKNNLESYDCRANRVKRRRRGICNVLRSAADQKLRARSPSRAVISNLRPGTRRALYDDVESGHGGPVARTRDADFGRTRGVPGRSRRGACRGNRGS